MLVEQLIQHERQIRQYQTHSPTSDSRRRELAVAAMGKNQDVCRPSQGGLTVALDMSEQDRKSETLDIYVEVLKSRYRGSAYVIVTRTFCVIRFLSTDAAAAKIMEKRNRP